MRRIVSVLGVMTFGQTTSSSASSSAGADSQQTACGDLQTVTALIVLGNQLLTVLYT